MAPASEGRAELQPPDSYFSTEAREDPAPAALLISHPSAKWTLVPPRWVQSTAGSWLGTRNWPKLLGLVVFLAAVIAASQLLDIALLEKLIAYLEDDLWRGGLIFVAFTAGVHVLLFPSAITSLTAGAIFGLAAGSCLAVLGTVIGQTLAFLVGRYLLREWVSEYMARHWPKWGAVDAAISKEGWKLVTLLRLSPIVPWNVLNFCLAVTGVGFWSFWLSSAASIVPWTVTLVYFGSLAKSMADIFNGASVPEGATQYAVFIFSGLMMVLTAAYATYISRRALSKALADSGETGQDIVEELDQVSLLSPRGGLGSPLGSSERYWCAPLGAWQQSQPMDARSSTDGWKSPPPGRRTHARLSESEGREA